MTGTKKIHSSPVQGSLKKFIPNLTELFQLFILKGAKVIYSVCVYIYIKMKPEHSKKIKLYIALC